MVEHKNHEYETKNSIIGNLISLYAVLGLRADNRGVTVRF